MKLHVINPNSSASMTDGIRRTAIAACSPGTKIIAQSAFGTPASIEGYADEARSVAAMLDAVIEAERNGAVAHIIACFDDPGLDAAREVALGPVIGLCEAAFIAAAGIAKRYSVVTTLPRSIPIIEELADRYGTGRGLRSIRAADVPVLDLECQSEQAVRKVAETMRLAVAEDGAEAVILGCAGMSTHLETLSAAAGVPVIDGLAFSVCMAEAFVNVGLRTSKVGAYAFPRLKNIPETRLASIGEV
ncbi:aspartate/glutamate racemase family protein [Parasedimentitalea psychrophila]|uniref:Aspartate/glutamate racemase family protein n=1 Tax=Parasedimentitalea psychrophila TaxID=2997337 RepID=A0A9Y2KZ70_9RHOB|nr:aspartate/glutamate racemase family protein [Parasedimentitalea psychrophila]WIY25820.1 aspartate/glutamate racemase family protein [Parasedimentitalea psychrophila]